MNIAEFVVSLRERGVQLRRDGERLKVSGPKSAVDGALRAQLAEHRDELLAMLDDWSAGEGADIPRIERAGRLPLSFAQERLWFLYELAPGSARYNMPIAVRMLGSLDPEALRAAVASLAARHEALRTTYETVDGQPMQIVHAQAAELDWSIVELNRPDDDAVREALAEIARRPFDLRDQHPLRAGLLRCSADEHVLLLVTHHIASDGWSTAILLDELGAAYAAAVEGTCSPPSGQRVDYADYAVWQRERLTERALADDVAFWRPRLADLPPVDLRAGVRESGAEDIGAVVTRTVSDELRTGLRELGAAEDATLFMTLLTAYGVLLGRLARQQEFLLGAVTANRDEAQLEDVVGFFVNLLPIPMRLDDTRSFRELLREVRQTAIDALSRHQLPFESLVEALHPDRVADTTPLVNAVLAVQNTAMAPPRMPGLDTSFLPLDIGTTRFDLALNAWDFPDQLSFQLVHRLEVVDRASAGTVLDRLLTLLRAVIAAPDRPLAQLSLMDQREEHRLLAEWNETAVADVPEVLPEQALAVGASSAPDAVAVESGTLRLTNRELDDRVSAVAGWLRRRGVGPDVPVGVCTDRSVDMVVAVLAVHRAGGAYVPLDPAYPAERLRMIIADAGLTVVLTDDSSAGALPATGAVVTTVSALLEQADADGGPFPPADLDSACVVYYTSGTTGHPKGVVLTHRGVLNYLHWITGVLDETGVAALPVTATLNSDSTLKQLFVPLLEHRPVWLVSRDVVLQPTELLAELGSRADSAFNCVPTLWTAVLDTLDAGLVEPLPAGTLRALFIGGEEVTPQLLRRTSRHFPGMPVYNLYGPSETTANSTAARVSAADEVTIGRPLANTAVYLLDEHLRPVPVGMVGELHIGGAGLARGYLGRSDLTADRFLPDPFAPAPGSRMYRTGDLGRYRPDGRIEFLGRADHQVKIRGFRVEPHDVAAVLETHPAVGQALVTVDTAEQTPRLVAYLTRAQEETPANFDSAGQDRVAEWREIHDANYSRSTGEVDTALDLTGWMSTYTREPIAESAMVTWVDSTVQRISELRGQRIVEIGCGSGLLLTRLAAGSKTYLGTDYSQVVLDQLRSRLTAPEYGHVRLEARDGDDFSGLAPGSTDTIVLNSVVQYFPSVDYLLQVLDGAVELLDEGGSIFVGDVRSKPLLETFRLSVELFQADGAAQGQLAWRRARQAVLAEKELVIDPALFPALHARYPRLSHVEVHHKRGADHNELTRFRYDVVLRFDGARATSRPDSIELPWPQVPDADLSALLADAGALPVVVRSVPNARLEPDLVAMDLIREGSRSTVEGVRAAGREARAIDPERLWDVARQHGVQAWCVLSPDARRGEVDVVFARAGTDQAVVDELLAADRGDVVRPWHDYANDPLLDKANVILPPLLRDHVGRQMPEYMIPAAIVVLQSFPLTPNGKVDRRALPGPDRHRADGDAEHVGPRDDHERVLCEVWQTVLGVDEISVHDNFFSLGGDSIISLQVVARARHAGLALTPRQMLEAQTVADLAALATELTSVSSEQGELVGEFPLLPIQRRFFELDHDDIAHYNQAILLAVDPAVPVDAVEQGLQQLVRHHDALRLRFTRDAGGSWRQRYAAAAEAEVPLDRYAEVAEGISRTHQSLDLTDGPLFRAAWFDGGDAPARLLLVAHHLVIDGISWRILVEDLHTVLSGGRLPAKSDSLRSWAKALTGHAESSRALDELPHWLATTATEGSLLPRRHDVAEPRNVEGRRCELAVEVETGTTYALLHTAGAAYRTDPDDLLLAALAIAVREVAGPGAVKISRESHGRTEFADVSADLSRTAGWFTSLFPVVIDLEGADEPGAVIKTVKQQLRDVPGTGAGYGVLRYLAGRRELVPAAEPEIGFNYLGRLGTGAGPDALLRMADEPTGPHRSAVAPRAHLIDINAVEHAEQLRLTWNYAHDFLDEATVRALADAYVIALRSLVAHAADHPTGGYTPSDFPLLDIGQAEIDTIVPAVLAEAGLPARPGAVEALLPLSPLQEGILFHVLYSRGTSLYVDQLAFTVTGPFDVAAFEEAWRAAVTDNATLRTGIFTEERPDSFAVVFRDAQLTTWRRDDLRALSAENQERALDDYLRADRERGFDLRRPPLLRGASFRLTDDTERVLLTSHHLVLDGWSLALLLAQVQQNYRQLVGGGRRLSHPVRNGYEGYLRWRRSQPVDTALEYWRHRLSGVTAATPLPGDVGPQGDAVPAKAVRTLTVATSDAVQAASRRLGLTLNTFLRAAWAVALASAGAGDDIVFGTAINGRPSSMPGFDTMIGVFINTIPVRVRLERDLTVAELLHRLQQEQIGEDEHGHLPLATIRRCSAVPSGQSLFESLMVLENYPLDPDALTPSGLVLGEVEGWTPTNYPLDVLIATGDRLGVTLTYDTRRFDAKTAESILSGFELALAELADSPDKRVGDLIRVQGPVTDPVPLELPTDAPADASSRSRFASTDVRIEPADREIQLAALFALLQRHTGLEDIFVGRRDGELLRALHTTVHGDDTIDQLAARVAAADAAAPAVTGARVVVGFEPDEGPAVADLTFVIDREAVRLHYDTEVFFPVTAERIALRYAVLLKAAIADPSSPVAALPLLTDDERTWQLTGFNANDRPVPSDTAFIDLFEAQAARTPDSIAVRDGQEELSYAELDARAGRIAAQLRTAGVRSEATVALLARRSANFLAAVLAVFKAGGAYVPLDPAYPVERLTQVRTFSGARLVLYDRQSAPLLERIGGDAGNMCIEDAATAAGSPPPLPRTPRDLAYVIYTSGSTGVPKGAMVENAGMVNHLYAKVVDLDLTEADVVVANAPISFDISVWQFLAALLVGAEVLVVSDEQARSPLVLWQEAARHGVTTLEVVPSLLRAALEEPDLPRIASLRWMVVTGEAVPPDLVADWLARSPQVPVVNAYGPTECSDDVTHAVLREPLGPGSAFTPIGAPVPNVPLYVLDEHGQLAPIGVPGELHVGGIAVGRGYLDDPVLTAQRFVPDPFGHGRLYRTGDLVRLRADATLEFLGRIDHQVKIRGHRVELGEIESALADAPDVRQALVVAHEDEEGRRLVAYLTGRPGQAPDSAELANRLRRRLPEYFVPAAFVVLEEFPLTANGKIDRRALPEPSFTGQGPIIAPRDEREELLAHAWSQALGVSPISVDSDFFELGGDSILSLRVIRLVKNHGYDLTPAQLFAHRTVEALAPELTKVSIVDTRPVPGTGSIVLTPAQQQFLNVAGTGFDHHNLAVFCAVDPAVTASMLDRALRSLRHRHDALRLRFIQDERGLRQEGTGRTDVHLHRHDLSALSDAEQDAALTELAAEHQRRLSLREGEVIGSALFDLGARGTRLLLVVHHLVVDVPSFGLLLEELEQACQDMVHDRPIRYGTPGTTFEHATRRLADDVRAGRYDGELSHWLSLREGEHVPLPTDGPAEQNLNGTLCKVSVTLAEDVTSALLRLGAGQAERLQLAALVATVGRWTRRERVLLWLYRHGRDLPGLSLDSTAGWFTSSFPVAFPATEADLPDAVGRALAEVPGTGAGFGLLRYLSPDARVRDRLAQVPSPEITFNYLGQFDHAAGAVGLVRPVDLPVGALHHPDARREALLQVTSRVAGGRLLADWEYGGRTYQDETVRALAADFHAEIDRLTRKASGHGRRG